MKFDTKHVQRAIDSLHDAAKNLSGATAAEFADRVGDALAEAAEAMQEIVNVLDDASEE
jgi:ABC-type transporter Mla subunit MlaD